MIDENDGGLSLPTWYKNKDDDSHNWDVELGTWLLGSTGLGFRRR